MPMVMSMAMPMAMSMVKLITAMVILITAMIISKNLIINGRATNATKRNHAAKMGTQALSTLAEEYFCSINSLTKRIGEDIAATKDAYEGLWNTLSHEEKNQAVDETIIQPEVALKYASKNINSSKDNDCPEYYPKLRIQTGMKYVIDDSGSTSKNRD
ncbi:unnamed protein product [Trichogramma brassicae]|uniref:DUF4706 domain-containing protein n=1 Tax=Trichogramma brassicae TaxID=86971 RepID=A0A6H5I0C2_9HYME|nr:unnamed protein product [Trichogramma brassicae]